MTQKEIKGDTTPVDTQQRVSKSIQQKAKKKILDKAKTLEKLKIEYVSIDTVRPNDYNPNRQSDHEFELLLRSMAEDGFTQPILITPDNIIVDGEHRWRGAKALHMEEIPVVRVNMKPEQMKVSTLRHNRARGSEDVSLVTVVLRDLEKIGQLDYAKEELMLSDVEINRILEDIPVSEALGMVEEFNESWIPDSQQGTNMEHLQHLRQPGHITPEALDKLREAEKKITQAKREEDRIQAIKERDTHQFSLTFTGNEIKLIKAVLDPEPAQRLIAICEWWKTNHPIEI